MTGLDVVAAIAAFTASAGLAVRSEMLRERFETWFTAPSLVRVAIFGLSVVMAIVGISICRTGAVSARDAGAYVAVAVVAILLAWNLYRQKRPHCRLLPLPRRR